MTTINISVKGKTALCPKRYLFSSNSNYRLKFNFDEEWNDSEVKTARIVFDNEYYDAVFTGDSVDLPKIPVCKELRVGVFTDALSTGFAQLGCIRSAADFIGDSVTEFTESQYDRIIALLNETDLRQISTVTRRDGNISFNFTNGTSQTVPIFDGVGIESAQVNSGGRLMLTLSDKTQLDCGRVTGEKGDKGDAGNKGDKGERGERGSTPQLTLGTVETAENASASLSGTAEHPVLNLALPRGETGRDGEVTKAALANELEAVSKAYFELFPDSARTAEALSWQLRGYENVIGKMKFDGGTAELAADTAELGEKVFIPAGPDTDLTKLSGFGAQPSVTQAVFESTMNAAELSPFTSCPSLKTVILPNRVNKLGGFQGSALESIASDTAAEIADNAFKGSSKLKSVYFPAAKTVGAYSFGSCTMLGSVTLNCAESIGRLAFDSCASLKYIDLPKASYLSSMAFCACASLTTLILRSETACRLASGDAFRGSAIDAGRGLIYVPGGLIDQYKTLSGWSKFVPYLRAIESNPDIAQGGI